MWIIQAKIFNDETGREWGVLLCHGVLVGITRLRQSMLLIMPMAGVSETHPRTNKVLLSTSRQLGSIHLHVKVQKNKTRNQNINQRFKHLGISGLQTGQNLRQIQVYFQHCPGLNCLSKPRHREWLISRSLASNGWPVSFFSLYQWSRHLQKIQYGGYKIHIFLQNSLAFI